MIVIMAIWITVIFAESRLLFHSKSTLSSRDAPLLPSRMIDRMSGAESRFEVKTRVHITQLPAVLWYHSRARKIRPSSLNFVHFLVPLVRRENVWDVGTAVSIIELYNIHFITFVTTLLCTVRPRSMRPFLLITIPRSQSFGAVWGCTEQCTSSFGKTTVFFSYAVSMVYHESM